MQFKNAELLDNFRPNQIVKGIVCGTFVILGFRILSDEWFAQLKCVDPDDYSRTSPGEFALPLANIKTIV